MGLVNELVKNNSEILSAKSAIVKPITVETSRKTKKSRINNT
jgi:hypothetical protein